MDRQQQQQPMGGAVGRILYHVDLVRHHLVGRINHNLWLQQQDAQMTFRHKLVTDQIEELKPFKALYEANMAWGLAEYELLPMVPYAGQLIFPQPPSTPDNGYLQRLAQAILTYPRPRSFEEAHVEIKSGRARIQLLNDRRQEYEQRRQWFELRRPVLDIELRSLIAYKKSVEAFEEMAALPTVEQGQPLENLQVNSFIDLTQEDDFIHNGNNDNNRKVSIDLTSEEDDQPTPTTQGPATPLENLPNPVPSTPLPGTPDLRLAQPLIRQASQNSDAPPTDITEDIEAAPARAGPVPYVKKDKSKMTWLQKHTTMSPAAINALGLTSLYSAPVNDQTLPVLYSAYQTNYDPCGPKTKKQRAEALREQKTATRTAAAETAKAKKNAAAKQARDQKKLEAQKRMAAKKEAINFAARMEVEEAPAEEAESDEEHFDVAAEMAILVEANQKADTAQAEKENAEKVQAEKEEADMASATEETSKKRKRGSDDNANANDNDDDLPAAKKQNTSILEIIENSNDFAPYTGNDDELDTIRAAAKNNPDDLFGDDEEELEQQRLATEQALKLKKEQQQKAKQQERKRRAEIAAKRDRKRAEGAKEREAKIMKERAAALAAEAAKAAEPVWDAAYFAIKYDQVINAMRKSLPQMQKMEKKAEKENRKVDLKWRTDFDGCTPYDANEGGGAPEEPEWVRESDGESECESDDESGDESTGATVRRTTGGKSVHKTIGGKTVSHSIGGKTPCMPLRTQDSDSESEESEEE